jgi:hypothetical protein
MREHMQDREPSVGADSVDAGTDNAEANCEAEHDERTHRYVRRTYFAGLVFLLVTGRVLYDSWPHAVALIALAAAALAAWALAVLTLFGHAIDRARAAEDARMTTMAAAR